MNNLSIGYLRRLAIRPSFSLAVLMSWWILQGLVNSTYSYELEGLGGDVLNRYIPLLATGAVVFTLANAAKEYRNFEMNLATAEGRYLKTSNAIVFVNLIIFLSFVFLSGLGQFFVSFASSGDGAFVDRLLLTYLPIIVEAGVITYGVYYGFVANRKGRDE